ncbi:MAG: O-antigen ligase family protein [Bacteroidia bacterium]
MKIALQIRWFLFLALGVGLSFPGAYGIQNTSVYGLIGISIFLAFISRKSISIPILFWVAIGYFGYLLGFEWLAAQNWPAFLKKVPLLLSVLLLAPPTEKEKKGFLYSVGISTIVSCLYLWVYHFLELVPSERFLLRSYSYTFLTETLGWQPIYTAISYSIGGLFWIHEIQKSTMTWKRILGSFGLGILFLTLVFLSARMAFLGFIFSSILLIPAKKRWIYLIGLGMAGALLLFNPILNERMTKAFSGSERYAGGNIRLEKWKAASNVFITHWIFGVSSGKSQQKLEEEYQKSEFQLGIKQHYHAHQQWLQNGVEGGLIGIAFLIFIFLAFFTVSFKMEEKLFLAMGLFLFLNTLTESICERQSGMIWFCILFLSGFVQKSDNHPTVVNKD